MFMNGGLQPAWREEGMRSVDGTTDGDIQLWRRTGNEANAYDST